MQLSNEVRDIPLGEIDISRFNVRRTGRDIDIEDLAESIEKHGLLQPVTLRGAYGKPPYELIVGQRRYLAHRRLRRSTIAAVFCGEVDDLRAKVLSLAENLHRLNLNDADKAEAITDLYLEYGKDIQRVARELHISPSTVRRHVKLEEQATPKAKRLLRARAVQQRDVRRVIDAAQGDAAKADRLLDEMKKLTKYEKDRAVTYGQANPDASATEVIEEAKKPRIQTTVILTLTAEVGKALATASRRLLMDRESIATRALLEWLRENGYLEYRE